MHVRSIFRPQLWLGLLLVALPALAQMEPITAPAPVRLSGARCSLGVVALSNTNSIRVLNGTDFTLSEPMLTGQLGSFGGGLFDVVLTPGGKTALVSNFGDSTVYMIDLNVPWAPVVKGRVKMTFFAEDIDVTPDGRFALVTDGGFTSRIAVINIADRTVEEFDFSDTWTGAEGEAPQFQSVSIMPDGRTVLCANYWLGKVEVLLLDADGTLTHTQSVPMPLQGGKLPRLVNVAVSPNGLHAVALSTAYSQYPEHQEFGGATVFLLKRVAAGTIRVVSDNGYELSGKGPQSAVFSPDGAKVYVSATSDEQRKEASALPPVTSRTFVRMYNVLRDSLVLSTDVELPGRGTSQLFGVDTIDQDESGRYLFVTNPTLSGGVPRIDVVDTVSRSLVRSYLLPDQTYTYYVELPESQGPVPFTETAPPIPTGIAFAKYPRFVRPGL
jgi:DNA-binding beta-propeller fold protein YncE